MEMELQPMKSNESDFYSIKDFNIKYPDAWNVGTKIQVKDTDGNIFHGEIPMLGVRGNTFTIDTSNGEKKKFNFDDVKIKLVEAAPETHYWMRGGRKTKHRRHKKTHRRHKKTHRRHKKTHRRHKK